MRGRRRHTTQRLNAALVAQGVVWGRPRKPDDRPAANEQTPALLAGGLKRVLPWFERYQRDMPAEEVQEYVKRFAAREGLNPAQKRGQQQTAAFVRLCYELWCRGASQAQIAAELGRSQQQVSRWVLKGRHQARSRLDQARPLIL